MKKKGRRDEDKKNAVARTVKPRHDTHYNQCHQHQTPPAHASSKSCPFACKIPSCTYRMHKNPFKSTAKEETRALQRKWPAILSFLEKRAPNVQVPFTACTCAPRSSSERPMAFCFLHCLPLQPTKHLPGVNSQQKFLNRGQKLVAMKVYVRDKNSLWLYFKLHGLITTKVKSWLLSVLKQTQNLISKWHRCMLTSVIWFTQWSQVFATLVIHYKQNCSNSKSSPSQISYFACWVLYKNIPHALITITI